MNWPITVQCAVMNASISGYFSHLLVLTSIKVHNEKIKIQYFLGFIVIGDSYMLERSVTQILKDSSVESWR